MEISETAVIESGLAANALMNQSSKLLSFLEILGVGQQLCEQAVLEKRTERGNSISHL
jgi:hypothetical protein